jgi:hypothetical protein
MRIAVAVLMSLAACTYRAGFFSARVTTVDSPVAAETPSETLPSPPDGAMMPPQPPGPPVAPTDVMPPVRSAGGPSGVLITTQVTLRVTTDEVADCRYGSVSGTPFDAMTGAFDQRAATQHAVTLTLADRAAYTFSIRCADAAANANTDDYAVSFSINQVAPPFDPVRVAIEDTQSAGSSGPVSLTMSSFSRTGNIKWSGGVMAPDGRIFGIPQDEDSVLVIDPADDSMTTFAHGVQRGGQDWNGGVLGQDGMIYAVPYCRNPGGLGQVMRIDPNDNTAIAVGTAVGAQQCANFNKGVLGLNGSLYMIPGSMDRPYKFDPALNTTVAIGSDYGMTPGVSKWDGGVLAPNGKIYGIPFEEPSILVIDPRDDSSYTLPLTGIASRGWIGGALAANGHIYGVPANSDCILDIDPSIDTYVCHSVPGYPAGVMRYWGGVLAMDGLIYTMPADLWGTNPILVINPANPTASVLLPNTLTMEPGGNYDGGVLGANGKVYAIPHRHPNVLIFDTHPLQLFPSAVLLSPYLNKY